MYVTCTFFLFRWRGGASAEGQQPIEQWSWPSASESAEGAAEHGACTADVPNGWLRGRRTTTASGVRAEQSWQQRPLFDINATDHDDCG